MNEDKEIDKWAKKYAYVYSSEAPEVWSFADGFYKGAKWYGQNLWHDARKERPEPGRQYLAFLDIPRNPTFVLWDCGTNHPFFSRWAYVSDLYPDAQVELNNSVFFRK